MDLWALSEVQLRTCNPLVTYMRLLNTFHSFCLDYHVHAQMQCSTCNFLLKSVHGFHSQCLSGHCACASRRAGPAQCQVGMGAALSDMFLFMSWLPDIGGLRPHVLHSTERAALNSSGRRILHAAQ